MVALKRGQRIVVPKGTKKLTTLDRVRATKVPVGEVEAVKVIVVPIGMSVDSRR